MACDCSELGQDGFPGHQDLPTTHNDTFSLRSIAGPNIPSSGSSVASSSPGFPPSSTTSISNAYVPSPEDLSPSLMTSQQPPDISCMWGNCNASFYSLSDLVGHVNLQHLRLPISVPTRRAPEIQQQHQDTVTDPISCLWGDCNVYPSPNSMPGSSSGAISFDTALSTLASHLFQDHLGLLNDASSTHVPVNTISAASTRVPDPSLTPSPESPGLVTHACSGTHVCHWQSCTQTFSSCDELTAHLASAHVGSGKAHYDCFWNDCKRHGEQGFSSKQKICRHLQVQLLVLYSH